VSTARRESSDFEPPGFERAEIEGSIPERFERVARAFSSHAAVREGGRVTTYAELADAAGRVRRRLAEWPGGTEKPVALLLAPGVPLFAAMLGTLGARRFYVPLDPRLPAARLEAIARRADAAAVIADADSASLAARLGVAAPVWRVEDMLAGPPAEESAGVSPDDLAYVLFTSGSTGEPKGVLQSHRNLLHNVRKLAAALTLTPADRLTQLSSPSFGASVSDVFGALLTGASICPYALAGDGLRRLPAYLEAEAITVYHSVPSVFRSFAATLNGSENLSSLRAVRLGGEPVLASDLDLFKNRFPRSCRFHVSLGATELHFIRHWSAGHDTPWPGGVPLGYPVDETEVVLLDEDGRESEGEGEIAIVARTLAVGYWKDPAGTAAAFRPVAGRPGFRMYRTGDLGRMLPDGCLLHAGRKDARLKVRGHRVEIAEVEAALLSVPGVREAAVEGRNRPEGSRLVAWIVLDHRERVGVVQLRRALSERLGDALVPSAFVFLDVLPRTASGKIDRKSLPEPGGSRPELSTPFASPRNPAEDLAAAAFARVLGLDRVGVDDDFFELGGDSLSAVELLAGLSDRLGAELTAADLLEAPTPASLTARAARAESAAAAPGLVRLGGGEAREVFVVPGGGGDGEDLFAARRLARLAGGAHSFYCFRSGPAPHPPVEEMADRCVRTMREIAPRGPYRIIGDCVGGILAVAIARNLRARGEEVALLALLDTPYPAAARRLRGWLSAHVPWTERLSKRARYFFGRLRYHSGVLRALPRGRVGYALRMAGVGARGVSAPATARQQESLERRASYVGTLLAWRPSAYDGAIHVIESEEAARRGFGEAWKRLAAHGPVVRVPGDHKDLILENGERVAAALAGWLADAV
jgi:amino acid adenylation domain-containing protein